MTLGIAGPLIACTIAFQVLFRPFPYRDASDIALVWIGSDESPARGGVSEDDISQWRQQTSVLQAIEPYIPDIDTTLGGDELGHTKGCYVGGGTFSLLGTAPLRGRSLTAADARAGSTPVAVVSARLATRFVGRAEVGNELRVEGRTYTIVGVMPASFFFPDTDTFAWLPLPDEYAAGSPSRPVFQAIARLQPGVPAQVAAARMSGQRRAAFRGASSSSKAVVVPVRQVVLGHYDMALLAFVGAAVIMYLIAAVDVSAVLMADALGRERELAVRWALGAPRWHLLMQAGRPSLVFALIGTCGGVVVATWAVQLVRLSVASLLPGTDLHVGLSTVVVAASLAFITPLLTGLPSIISTIRVHFQNLLRDVGSTTAISSRRLPLAAVVLAAQSAILTALLATSWLLLASFVELSRVHWGVDAGRVAVVSLDLPPSLQEKSALDQWASQMMPRIEGLPGVDSAAITTAVPVRWTRWRPTPLEADGRMTVGWSAAMWTIGPGHFRALGVKILEGREFGWNEPHQRNGVVISRSLAKRLWPGREALGCVLYLLELKNENGHLLPAIAARLDARDSTLETDPTAWQHAEPGGREVVGVVEDVRMFGLDVTPMPSLYVDFTAPPRTNVRLARLFVIAHVDHPPATVLSPIRRLLTLSEPSPQVVELTTLSSLISESVGGRAATPIIATVAGVLAVIGLLVIAVGIHGSASFYATARTREWAIRSSLGASPSSLVRRILMRSTFWAALGVVPGVAGAVLTNRGLAFFFYGISPTSWAPYVIGSLILISASLTAALPSAIRAAKAGPSAATRAE